MKFNLKKLALTPSDILIVTIANRRTAAGKIIYDGRAKLAARIHETLRKTLPPHQRSLVKFDDVKIEKLADVLTPEDLHVLNAAMDKKLLAAPAAGLPLQGKA
jgi:hypothetical protein